MITRRKLLQAGTGLAAAAPIVLASNSASARRPEGRNLPYMPVKTLNGSTLPFEMDGGVKVFHLIAETFEQEFAPGLKVKCWGYNGQTPGPTIEAVEGDRVRILITNNLPEPTSVHWHGILLPHEMDGVSGLHQPPVPPGETFAYEFTLRQNGTQMYHPHFDEMTQMALGMMGFFIIHPREPRRPKVDRDYAIFLYEWKIDPGAFTPNTTEMTDFNYFTFNSHVYPGTSPILAEVGDRVRVRFATLGMNIHPIHFHGIQGRLTGTDGGQIPETAQVPDTTVLVSPGQTRDFEFVTTVPGDWPVHCHKSHHTMNGMAHGLPNMLGVDPGSTEEKLQKQLPGYMTMGTSGHEGHVMKGTRNTVPMGAGAGPFGSINMGGMFTLMKVRPKLNGDVDPGWWRTEEDPSWHRWRKGV